MRIGPANRNNHGIVNAVSVPTTSAGGGGALPDMNSAPFGD